MTDNDKLKEEILKKHKPYGREWGEFLLPDQMDFLYKALDSYHLARLEIPEKEIDEMATQYDNGGLNQSQWVGFTWGAKATLEKLRQ